MASTRKFGREDSTTRVMLLDATQEILVEHGHSALTSRRIAKRVGVSHQTVFYYFASIDDLLLELIDRNALEFRNRLRIAMDLQHPLRALWEIARDRESGMVELQLKALAVHNEQIRLAMSGNLEIFRVEAAEALADAVGSRWPDQPHLSIAAALMIEGIGRYLVLDDFMAITKGHEQVLAAIESLIIQFETYAWREVGNSRLEPPLPKGHDE